jgi:hypothetical protein
MDADLARMKTLLEKGKTTAGNKTATREQVMPVTGRGARSQSSMQDASDVQMPSDANSDMGGPIDYEGGVGDSSSQ